MPQLPTDIVFPILLLAYAQQSANSYSFTTRRAWFASTLLISRAWYAAGQPLLYRRIVVHVQEEWHLDSLLYTLSSPSRTTDGTVARMVRWLHIENVDHRQPHRRLSVQQILPKPSIPIITEKGRRARVYRRRYNKLCQLLALCSSLVGLKLDVRDLKAFSTTLDNLWTNYHQLQRIEVDNGDRLHFRYWDDFSVRSKFWSNLRELRIDASHHFYSLDLASNSGSLGSLRSLEVCADVRAVPLRNTLHAVRSTLRTLACNQPRSLHILRDADLFEPVARTLTSLTISLDSRATLVDLSAMTALNHLSVVLSSRRGDTAPWLHLARTPPVQQFPTQIFPPSLITIEWRAKERVDPWIVAERVRDTLRAFDHGRLLGLRSVIITATLQRLMEVQKWTIVAALLHGVIQTRPEIHLEVDLLLDLNHFQLHRFDCFVRQMNLRKQQRMEDLRQETQRRAQGWRRVLHGGLHVCGRLLACVHMSVCCVLYAGCCCCLVADYVTIP